MEDNDKDLKKCPACGGEIAKDARKCKHCWTDINEDGTVTKVTSMNNQKVINSLKIGGITILIIVLAVCLIIICNNNDKTPNCFDEITAKEVGEIYKYNSELPYLNYKTEEHAKSNATEYNTQLKDIEEISYDKANDYYICRAKLQLTPVLDPIYGGIMYDSRKLRPDEYSTYYNAQMIQYDVRYYISGGKKLLNVKAEWNNRELFGTSIGGD